MTKACKSSYYQNLRLDALSLLPRGLERVVEIGCGEGNSLAWLKTKHDCCWVGGVEAYPKAAEQARPKLDMLYEGDIESMELPIEPGSLDAVLCLDVLEHLVFPDRVLARARVWLKPGGLLVASIPNVRNWRVVLPLIFMGRWQYQDHGILDRTHLRFFTRESARQLVIDAGFSLDIVASSNLKKGKVRLLNGATLGIFKEFLVLQYVIRAKKDHA